MYCLRLAALLSYFSNGYNMVGFTKGRLNRFKILTEINVSDGLHRRLKLLLYLHTGKQNGST